MKRLFFAFALLLIVLPLGARTRYTINDGWQFRLGNETTVAGGWEQVSIPHTWNAADCDDDAEGFHRGAGIYRRVLMIDPAWIGKRLTLHFEGANTYAEVRINGKLAGSHCGGSTAFAFDITEWVVAGANQLEVLVDNTHNPDIPPLSADYTFFGGLYRDVALIVTEQQQISTTHYASSGVYLTTPKVDATTAEVAIRTMLTNGAEKAARVQLRHRIFDPAGRCVAEATDEVRLDAKAVNQEVAMQCAIAEPQLWDVETPHLYRVVTTLSDKSGNLLDEVSNPLGVRTIRFDADKGFFLNGKAVKLLGTNRHQCYRDLGYALSDERHLRDVEQLKRMGGNFLRISHYPQDPTVTAACDRMGILAAIEIPIVNAVTPGKAFAECCETMMTEMIYQNFNAPSICIWAYMNEVMLRIPVEGEEALKAYYKDVYAVGARCEAAADRIDPSRPTMIPCHGNLKHYDASGLLTLPDIIGMNIYHGWYQGTFAGFDRQLDKLHATYPTKSFIVTEYGGDCDIRIRSFRPERFDFSVDYAMLLHEHYLRAIRERGFVAGSTVWNLNDFYSEGRGDALPHINCKGLCTLERTPKDTYHFYRAALRPDPVVHICSMSYPYRSGVETAPNVALEPVKIYTNAAEVEVLHNGRSLGKYKPENFAATVEVPFTNGVNRLEAVIEGGREVATTEYRLVPKRFDEGTPFTEMNILLGSTRSFVDPTNEVAWIPDQPYSEGGWGYVGGEPWRPKTKRGTQPASNLAINRTTLDPMYQTQRRGIEAFRADLPDGSYEVTLHFAELTTDEKKADLAYLLGADAATEAAVVRRFDIAINGSTVAMSLDVAAEVGRCAPFVRRYRVEVTDGKGLSIDFKAVEGETMLSAIRILKVY